MNDSGKASILDRFGHLREVLAAVDWARTPLGEPEQWVEPLCLLVSTVASSHRPMFLAWGPEHTLFCNAACTELLDDRHPEAFGNGFSKVFAGGAAAARVLERINAGQSVDFDGPDHAFSCTCTPITGAHGQVAGFIATDFQVPAPKPGYLRAEPSVDVSSWPEPAHYRRLFERVDQPVCIVEVALAADGEAIDARFVDANTCFLAQAGWAELRGKTLLELLPDVDAVALHAFGEVVRTGRTRRFRQEAFGRSLEVFACPVGGEREAHRVAAVVRDVSELERRTGDAEFLAELSADFSRVSGFQETLAAVAPKLADYLGVERVTFAEVDEEAQRAVDLLDFHVPGVVRVSALFELQEFMTPAAVAELDAGGTIVVNDVAIDPRTRDQIAAWRRFGAGATAQVPHHAGERLQFLLGVYRTRACEWTDGDLRLLREVAVRLWSRFERARVADALLESQARLRRSLRAAKIVAWEWDEETRRLTTFPETASDRSDVYFDANDLAEGFRRIHPQDKSRNHDLHLQAFRERRSYLSVYRARHRDSGDWFWVEEFGRPDDSPDGSRRFFGVLRDITRTREAELEVGRLAAESARRQRQHAAIMASTPDHLYLFDVDLRLVFANASLLELLGLSWEDAEGRHLTDLGFPPWDVSRHDEEVQRVLATTEPVRGEVQFVGVSGTRRYGYVLTPLLDGEGKVEGVVGTSRDITEQTRVETALKEADERKDEFLALLSHELRNPLAAIQLSLHVMGLAEPGSAPARQAREIIERQANQLTRLVGDLLDATRIARGKIRLQMSRIELVELVRNAVTDQQALFDAAGTTLTLQSAEGPLYVDGDADRLAQVIGNLLQNAAKFSPGGHTWVTMATDPVAGGVAIRVRDDGMGIDAETLTTLFEPFVQSPAVLDQAGAGLGLGLALVKGLVELHGGEVTAGSAGPGQGATFVVTLPASSRERPAPALVDAPAAPGVRALLIEDNQDLATGFGLLLEGGGHEVVIVNDGESGLACARRTRPDVIFCDLGLSGMDGYAVARAVRQDAELRATLLIAVSGYARPEDVARAREAGFDEHLAKPPDLARINALLAGRRRA